MGLERVTAVIQGKLSNYDTDLLHADPDAIGERAGRPYRATSIDDPADVSMRVIADHLRAMTFLIADGVVPSNEHRGYVLRKIMRRAMRHGKKLGFTEPFLHAPGRRRRRARWATRIPSCAQGATASCAPCAAKRIASTRCCTAGLPRLEDVLDRAAAGNRVVPGEDAFRLYDSLGVPLDFIEDLAGQRQLALDREGFDRAMAGQREKARAGSTFKGGDKDVALDRRSRCRSRSCQTTKDEFVGYESTRVQGAARPRALRRHRPAGATR